jgi:WD40 repeat protein
MAQSLHFCNHCGVARREAGKFCPLCGHPYNTLTPPAGLTLLHTLEGHTNVVSEVGWSPAEKYLASCSGDRTVRIWDATTGALLRTLEGHTNRVRSVAWSPDGKQLVSGSDETVHYTNAKVVLVGDSGVGKSGLGLVLSGQLFTVTESTHARRVWNFDSQEVSLVDRPLTNHTNPPLCS